MSTDAALADPFLPPPAPEFGEPVSSARASAETLELMARRRSTPAAKLTGPGPSPEQVDALLRLAARAPDHKKLAPWRFVVFEGDARARAGRVIADAFKAAHPDADDQRLGLEALRFERAPTVVAVVSAMNPNHPAVPEWEQGLSAGAVCQNLVIAAHAMGFAGQWLTEWLAYDAAVVSAFGLGPFERIAGYVYLGTAADEARERPRPDVGAITTRWTG